MAEPSFLFTPEEAQSVARRVILALEAQGYQCVVEQSVGTDAPFVPTLTAKKSRSPQRCIETQADTHYTGSMKALRNWMWSERFYGTLSICTSDTSTIAARTLHELKRDGVGLSIVAPCQRPSLRLSQPSKFILTPIFLLVDERQRSSSWSFNSIQATEREHSETCSN